MTDRSYCNVAPGVSIVTVIVYPKGVENCVPITRGGQFSLL